MALKFVVAPRTRDDINDLNRWPREISKAVNTIGKTGYGSASISPDGNGNGTIAHELIVTPSYVQVGISGDNAYSAKVESVDSTNITVLIQDAGGSDVTSGSYTVYWIAKV